MTKKLSWRLSNLPTAEELRGLVTDGIMTKEEAREVLFNEESKEDRDKKSLETEVKFLRDLVNGMANNRGHIVETIQLIEPRYKKWDWYKPYDVWCGATTFTYSSSSTGKNALYTVNTTTAEPNFNEVKTF